MKIKTYIASIAIITFCFAMSLIVFGYTLTVKDKENRLLQDDINRLEIDLADRENEIYELMLDLKTTEKSLAETSHQNEVLASKLNEIEENDKDIELEYIGEYKCTAYCCERYAHICGTGTGKTATGVYMQPDVTVAVTDLKTFSYGTVIYIEDVGIRIVQDTGGFPKNQIDCAVDTHSHASHWEGQGKHKVYIIHIGDADEKEEKK